MRPARDGRAAVDQIKEWSDYYGRPVYLGEFGAYTTADPASRANYYRDLPRGPRGRRHRLGDLGLEGRVPLLEREDERPRARHARGPLRQAVIRAIIFGSYSDRLQR